ncbi:MAG TPA: MarR family transcriptional regulator [Cellulomonas sp.]
MDQPDEAVRTVEAQVAMLLRLSERGRRSAARRLGELERSAYLVLGVLDAAGPANVNAIADALRLDPSTMTRQVLAMEQAGHVVRRPDPTDGRATVVETTPAGRAALAATREDRAQVYAEILDGWSAGDRRTLAAMLSRLNQDLDGWGRRHSGR